jgi:uracil-DNA glycosylase
MATFQKLIKEFTDSEPGYNLRTHLTKARTLGQVFPEPDKVFAAFNDSVLAFDEVKMVIVGQDPYPTPGDANGFAFSSSGTNIPFSLQIIFKEIRNSLYSYMGDNSFIEGFNSPNLSNWTKQGILLMNRVLTVASGQANSHVSFGWQYFTNKVIQELNDDNHPKVFMLWGANAKELIPFITNKRHLVLESAHPASEAYKPGQFLGNGHFEKAHWFLFDNDLISDDLEYDYSGIIPEKEFIDYIQTKIIQNKIPIPTSNIVRFKENILKLYRFKCERVIDYRTIIKN